MPGPTINVKQAIRKRLEPWFFPCIMITKGMESLPEEKDNSYSLSYWQNYVEH